MFPFFYRYILTLRVEVADINCRSRYPGEQKAATESTEFTDANA
jgi:hypothetical protein